MHYKCFNKLNFQIFRKIVETTSMIKSGFVRNVFCLTASTKGYTKHIFLENISKFSEFREVNFQIRSPKAYVPIMQKPVRDHPFSTYGKISEKLTFLTP